MDPNSKNQDLKKLNNYQLKDVLLSPEFIETRCQQPTFKLEIGHSVTTFEVTAIEVKDRRGGKQVDLKMNYSKGDQTYHVNFIFIFN